MGKLLGDAKALWGKHFCLLKGKHRDSEALLRICRIVREIHDDLTKHDLCINVQWKHK